METALEELFVLSNPVGQEMAVWGDARLEIAYFLSSERPNERYVTSVRAVVLRGESVLVVRDSDDTFHVVPGGRREPGESVAETLSWLQRRHTFPRRGRRMNMCGRHSGCHWRRQKNSKWMGARSVF
ncbi:MAG: hypothetical protein KC418_11240 [Anaerolineales bacterium]|nr:hypothetical protein [Anaerolineales bacterium]MCB8952319.1 hypothetical protein [Ardenticatenales bacterium]